MSHRPSTPRPLAPLSILDIRRRVEAGALTPEAAIAQSRQRIDDADEALLAFARRAAPDAAVPAQGPLAGISLGIKDIFDTADLPTAYGSPIYAGHRPRADAALVAIARAAGAFIAGKTHTTEFAFMTPAPTRNPHDPARTPGGSSSGSAAAVAAGLVAGAFGSQTAGSTIRPASFCGVAGFKPSFRLLPTVGMKTFAWSLDTAGLFAAGVRDVADLAAILSDRGLGVGDETPSALRVGLYRSGIDGQLGAAMADAWVRGAAACERLGWRLLDIVEDETLRQAREVQPLIQDYEGAVSLTHERLHHGPSLSDGLRLALQRGAAIPAERYDDARRTARNGRRAVNALFTDCDVMLSPSAPGEAPLVGEGTGDPAFNRLWTLAGTPCVNVPGLRSSSGLPLGLTVSARFGRDRLALVAAAALESVLCSA